ncbi:MAG TPA: amidohydrolase family protein [Niabella sp.]|nr:amidohydrolase family protein [Niabella sp.]HOZ97450.1 amidohydrolase family protein [Niabella sp.]HQW15182.1 amidohydrolase family protein [Niabella sp.]HQX20351.1 amidohydrolase family protein [Niabella sp.]HQX41657.1 amidohydrolase family protein [Niabella sp.]
MAITIDAHQHFWKFDPIRDAWIDDSMKKIQRDFLPADLEPVLKANGIDGCVVVQSDQSEVENIFQLSNAMQYDFVKGVVGWVDLQARDIQDKLAHFSYYKKMKGFRHVLQGEKDRALMMRKRFLNGIGLLEQYNFTYDILIFPDQIRYATNLAAAFPNQRFVIDHLAKPYIRDKKTEGWKQDMQNIAQLPNVFCKISGMVTEADWRFWKPIDFNPYLDIVVEAFGTKRIMYGSDWPVCLVAASYKKMKAIVDKYFQAFSSHEKQAFYGGNAIRFYRL